MNRLHYVVAYSIIMILLAIPLLYKYHIAMDMEKESGRIDRTLYNSMYSGLITYNEYPSVTDNGERICRSFINYFSHQSNLSEEEIWGYIPVFVILDTSEYYMIFPGINGRDYTKVRPCPYIYDTENIDYEAYFFNHGTLLDDTSYYTLDGEVLGTEEVLYITGGSLSAEQVRGKLQLQIEDSVNTAIEHYNLYRNGNNFEYEMISDLILTPDKSIVTVFQGYPLANTGVYYNNTYQVSGQVQSVN